MSAGVVSLFVSGGELWISDGTEGGTVTLASVAPQVAGIYDRPVGQFDDGSYLFLSTAYTSENYHEFGNDYRDIWVTDGTAAGTHKLASVPAAVEDLLPSVFASYIGSGITALSVSYADYSDYYGNVVHQLGFWSDGTPAGTYTSPSGGWASTPAGDPLALGNGKSVFTAYDAEHGRELWVTDGTPGGASLLVDFTPGGYGPSDPHSSRFDEIFSTGNGQALLSVNGELWVTNGTAAGTQLLASTSASDTGWTGSLYPSAFQELADGRVLFMGMVWEDLGDSGQGFSRHIWITDHTAAGTHFISDSSMDGYTSTEGFGRQPAILPDSQFLFVKSGDLWISDGTTEGTRKLIDIYAGNLANVTEVANHLVSLPDGRVLFQGNDGIHGKELWVTDGTAAGTHLLKDIFEGPWGSNPDSFQSLSDGTVMFRAYDPATGGELWITDGTAEGTRVVKDIQPPDATSTFGSVSSLMALGDGRYLFGADDGAHGNELWITDGSADGTVMVKDVAPGLGNGWGSSTVMPIATGDGRAVFVARTAEQGQELWVTDGTAAGTTLLADITPGAGHSTFSKFTTLSDGRILFGAQQSYASDSAWITDGTTAGTFRLSETLVGIQGFVDLGTGRALIGGRDGASGPYRLWTTDGTTAGTAPINAGLTEGANATGERIVNTFRDLDQNPTAAATLTNGSQIVVWTSSGQDGSSGGVYAQRFAVDGSPTGVEFRVNTTTANDQREGAVAALSDGGFVVVWNSVGQDGNLSGIVGQRYNSSGATVGNEFIVNNTRTNEQYTPEVQGLATGGFVVSWSSMLQDGSHLGVFARRFDASGNAFGTTEFQVNGTAASEQHGSDIAAWSDGSFIITWRSATASGYDVFAQLFAADGSKTGGEFRINQTATGNQFDGQVAVLADGDFVVTWRSQGQDGNGDEVYARHFGRDGQAAGNEFRVNSTLANDQAAPAIVALNDGGFVIAWRSTAQDGDGFGVFAQKYDANGLAQGGEFAVSTQGTGNQGDYLALAPGASGGFTAFWSSDGGQDGSGSGVISRQFDAGGGAIVPTTTLSNPGSFFSLLDGRALFSAYDSQNDAELWVSDGTAAGTRVVMDINTAGSSAPVAVALLEAGRALVLATDATHGRELWVTNGSESGTRLVADINPGTGGSDPQNFLSLGNGRVLFSATTDYAGSLEPWITDGTAAGTFRLGDLYAGSAGSTPGGYCSLGNGKVVFSADTFAAGRELWVTDGTVAGTSLIANINPALYTNPAGQGVSSLILNLTALGDGRAVFSANDGVHGSELWITDGTASGTMLVKDINPLVINGTPESSGPGHFIATGDGRALFSANDGVHGWELWITDGSAAGTVLVTDINTLPRFLFTSNLLGTLDANLAPQLTGAPVALANGTEDVAYTFAKSSLLTGYTDPDGETPQLGTVSAVGATLVDNGDGSMTVTTPANFSGPVTINFSVRDGVGGVASASTTLLIANVAETGTAVADALTASPNGDTLLGLDGNDTLNGGAGADTLDGGAGTDSMTGGAGNDTYIVDALTDLTIETNRPLDVDTVVSSINWSLGVYIEHLELTGAALDGNGNGLANRVTGTAAANSLSGNTGNDTLLGGDGDDTLNGGVDADSLVGGNGSDTYFVDVAIDVVVEEAGLAGDVDTVQSSITWTLGDNLENLVLSGGAASSGYGNAQGNKLDGNAANNRLEGGAGNDTLAGNAGDDTLVGGEGSDTYVVSSVQDVIEESGTNLADVDSVQSTVSWTLGANLEQLVLIGTAAITGTGNAQGNLIIGNGTTNTLDGGAGDDTLDGAGGADTLMGGAGNDRYIAGSQDTIVETGADAAEVDTVESGSSWTLGDNLENLLLTGDAAINGNGNMLGNRLTGNAAANVLDGLAGNDTLVGGAGNDRYVVDSLQDQVLEDYLPGEIDQVESSVSWTLGSNVENLVLTGALGITGKGNGSDNVITGNGAANLLAGNRGDDTLQGNGGNDTIDGGLNADAMSGGAGNDVYIVDNAGDTVSESSASGGNDTVKSLVTFTLGEHVEHLQLIGAVRIDGTGNALSNSLLGNEYANVLSGGDGNDTLTGAAGNDTLVGGEGGDTYVVNSTLDVVTETGAVGIDTVQAVVKWTLGENLENLVLQGQARKGTGNALDNVLSGNASINLLDGGAGSDTLAGGEGDDIYYVNMTTDVVQETGVDDLDTVRSSVSWTLGSNLEALELLGAERIDGTGNGLANLLQGNKVANHLSGGAGNDTLQGLNGNDTLRGGEGDDFLQGGNGNDTYIVDSALDVTAEYITLATEIDIVQSSVDWALGNNIEHLTLTGTVAVRGTGNGLANVLTGNDVANSLAGQGGDDMLWGNNGADTLQGGNGNDTLAGGGGADRLDGGAGADAYLVSSALGGANVDTIAVFVLGEDRLQLADSVFGALAPGALAASAFHLGTAAAAADDRILYDAATGSLYYDPDGTGAGFKTKFAILENKAAISAADIEIV